MKKIIFIYLFFSSTILLYGQFESANWYFGNQAGLNYSEGIPELLSDGLLSSSEGCAVISSSNGDLLFYTNGNTLWNRFHENIASIDGHDSSTQGVLFVPHPGNSDLYYLFVTDAVQFYIENDGSQGNGLNYYLLDTSLDGGAVIASNVNILPSTSEKITAVAAENGEDVWVITQYENRFYSILITANEGLDTDINPIVESSVPFSIDDFNNLRGALKVSPTGSKLAITHLFSGLNSSGTLLLYDFDSSSGIVSNEQFLDNDFSYYGAEFSSNGEVLYASGVSQNQLNLDNGIVITQFDLKSNDISASRSIVTNIADLLFQNSLGGSLQLALDRKIYYSRPSTIVSVINNPNIVGPAGADFDTIAVELETNTRSGLPSYIQSYFESIFEARNLCVEDEVVFNLFQQENIESVSWDFDDPASGTDNTSTSFTPMHSFTQIGTYSVTADIIFNNGRIPKTFVEFITISNTIPDIDSDFSLTQCDSDGNNDGITIFNLNEINESFIDAFDPDFQYSIHLDNNDAEDNINLIDPIGYENVFNGQTLILRIFENSDCFTLGTLTLNVVDSNDVGNITILACVENEEEEENIFVSLSNTTSDLQSTYPGDITFYVSHQDALLELNSLQEETFEVFPSDTPQLFFRSEQTNECTAIGGLFFDIEVRPVLEDQNKLLCDVEDGVTLSVSGTFNSYLWSTGEMTPTITVFETGVFDVTVANGTDCTTTSSITVETIPPLIAEILVEDFRQNNRIIITTNDTNATQLFSINGGLNFQTENIFENLTPGIYLVVISDELGCNREQFVISVRGAPNFFTPNNDGINDLWHVNRPELLENWFKN